MLDGIKTFFERHPALLYALFLLFGFLSALGHYSSLIVALILYFLIGRKKRLLLLLVSAFVFFHIRVHIPDDEIVEGVASVKILSMKKFNKRGWSYRVKVERMLADGKEKSVATGVVCSLFSPEHLDPDCTFLVKGKLIKKGPSYVFKTTEPWQVIKKGWRIKSIRQAAKTAVNNYLTSVIEQKKACALLSGLATGEMSDPILSKEFERRGLSHLLAISGFHFALVGLCFHFILRLFFPPKITACFLIVVMTLYFLFIGNLPSVARAYVMAVIALGGMVIEKRGNGLNSLGIALILALLLDPLVVLNVGFVLSFLATAGILLFYAPCELGLRAILPSKNVVFDFLRKSLAIGIAVHIALIAHLLAYFHKMPLHGLLYNLFVPMLVTGSIILLICGTLIHLILPWIGLWVHQANGMFTASLIQLIEAPLFPHKTWYVTTPTAFFLTFYLTAMFGGGIILIHYLENRHEKRRLEFCYFGGQELL